MVCPECDGVIRELYRRVELNEFGALEIIIRVCQECAWCTIHDWNRIKQYKMSLENKEEMK